jgi:opacity protein-like surface antigen
MIALALALSLAAAGPGDADLPRTLGVDESRFMIREPLAEAKADPVWWIGAHMGLASAYDSSDVAFVLGASGRVHILPWLGAEASIDFQTNQSFEHHQIHTFQVPFEFTALFYPPLEGQIRPYGIAGIGFTITDATYSGALAGQSDTADLNALFFLGFGMEFELEPNILLDANLRFVFATDPPHFSGNSADWLQFTLGILIKLAK